MSTSPELYGEQAGSSAGSWLGTAWSLLLCCVFDLPDLTQSVGAFALSQFCSDVLSVSPLYTFQLQQDAPFWGTHSLPASLAPGLASLHSPLMYSRLYNSGTCPHVAHNSPA